MHQSLLMLVFVRDVYDKWKCNKNEARSCKGVLEDSVWVVVDSKVTKSVSKLSKTPLNARRCTCKCHTQH